MAYIAMGILLVINFLNLIHDAAHNTLFNKKWINGLYVHFFDFLGANSYMWQVRHINLHHRFPNVMDWDSDIEQSPLAKIFPQAASKPFHRYQHIYLPFLYPLYLFNWLLVRDFKDYFTNKTIAHKVVTIPRREYIKLIFFKPFFLFYLIAIPKWVLGTSWMLALTGFCAMVLSASILSLLVLLSPHANVESEFPAFDSEGKLPYTWFEHQLRCTNDVSNTNFFVRFFMGNFNYHIAHHLFPNINHIHYPAITPSIVRFAQKHNLPYRSQSLGQSLANHYKLLKNNALNHNIFEETM